MATRDEMAISFGAHADTYQRGRPDYPVSAVAWMLAGVDATARVVDVGAGTGKLSASVRAAGFDDLTAVDPDADMLAQLRSVVPGVPTLVGTAERMPFDDASADAVVLGQAWHWVDPVVGSREVGRVVRPGGRLGLIWNERDAREPWVARLTEIMHGSEAEKMLATGGPTVAAPFGPLESKSWHWQREMDRQQLLAMARSRSYVIAAAPAERARIEAGMADLFDEIGAVGDATVLLPYRTVAFRSVRAA